VEKTSENMPRTAPDAVFDMIGFIDNFRHILTPLKNAECIFNGYVALTKGLEYIGEFRVRKHRFLMRGQ